MLQTCMGQQLDMMTAQNGRAPTHADFARFTEARYNTVVAYKTAFYSFCLPVESALTFAASLNGAHARVVGALEMNKVHSGLMAALVEIGVLFQIQDDVLDCFGDATTTGKHGTDIAECKCSWLIVQALKRADDAQRRTLLANYGRNVPECVEAVKSVYRKLDLERAFQEHEAHAYDSIMERIRRVRVADAALERRFHAVLISLLTRMHKRKR
jgi:farnesyl diphosphate synthase